MRRGSSTRKGPDRRTGPEGAELSPEPSGPNNVPGAATGRRFPLPFVY